MLGANPEKKNPCPIPHQWERDNAPMQESRAPCQASPRNSLPRFHALGHIIISAYLDISSYHDALMRCLLALRQFLFVIIPISPAKNKLKISLALICPPPDIVPVMSQNTMNGQGDSALGERKVYFAHVCGFAAIRDAITDEILYHLSERKTPESHLASAQKIAKKFGWKLV